MRTWSSLASAASRMPGVTRVKSGPVAWRMRAASWAEHTTPSRPQARARRARRSTFSSTGPVKPTRSRSCVREAGEDRDRDEQRRARHARDRVARRAHHRFAAARVHVDHPHAQPRGRAARAGDGVGDVVELEVEEHIEAALLQLLHHRRSRGDEELLADLHAAKLGIEARGDRERRLGIGEVQRNDDASIVQSASSRGGGRSLRARRCGAGRTSPSRRRPDIARRTAAP